VIQKEQPSRLLETQMPDKPLPRRELARFLRRLSRVYADPLTGNIALSVALEELSSELAGSARKSTGPAASRQEERAYLGPTLASLSREQAIRLVSDTVSSRTDLIRLGVERLSIPRARLLKMSRADLVETIKAALRHETSLVIIGEAANRDGAVRKS
jgi:hypothetical protein